MKPGCIRTSRGAGFLASFTVPRGPKHPCVCSPEGLSRMGTQHTRVQPHPTKTRAFDKGPEVTSHSEAS